MRKRKSIFGPSKDEIWSQIATDIGGEFTKRKGGKGVLLYRHGEWQILLSTYTVRTSGDSSTTDTQMRARFINKGGLYFRIYREGFFSSIGKFFGMQDIKIGDPFFDKQFVIKGNNPEKIKQLLADSRVKELCQRQPSIHLRIKNNELYFTCAGVMKEKVLLKGVFELFGLILERLVQIDSAYADDPQVTLK